MKAATRNLEEEKGKEELGTDEKAETRWRGSLGLMEEPLIVSENFPEKNKN